MKQLSTLFVFILLLLTAISTIKAEDYEDEDGEIRLEINHERLPAIRRNWTSINLTLRDITGIDWDRFFVEGAYNYNWMQIAWPIIMFNPDIVDFLGYNSLLIEINILSDNPEGWNAKIEPGNIPKTSYNYSHNLTLSVKTTDLCADYNPTLELVFTRTDREGQPIAQTKAYIPLKAEIASFTLLQTPQPTQKTAPKTISTIPFSITHKGEYSTTYHMKAEYANDLVVQLSDQYITLRPNEAKTCQLVVLTPERLYEPGANYPVTVTAIAEDGSAIHSAEFMVISQGFYLSQLLLVLIISTIILLLIMMVIIRKIQKSIKHKENKDNIESKLKKNEKKKLKEKRKIQRQLEKNEKRRLKKTPVEGRNHGSKTLQQTQSIPPIEKIKHHQS